MKTIIAVIFLVFAIIIGLSAIDTGKSYIDKQLGLTENSNTNSLIVDSSSEIVYVNITISGEVVKPGTYEIESGSFLEELIEKAGGVTSLADTDCFDYYLLLEEDLTLYIPKVSDTEKISINYASLEELMSLVGIGKTIGSRIITYRDEVKAFDYLEEIMKVEGVGKSIFNKIRDDICL